MHEREVLFTGVGGQGVQIVSKALAMAAVAEGREALLLPQYGGGMRGSKTNAELTVGDAPLRALPIVIDVWSAFVMDQAFWETIRPKLAPGAVVVVNSSLFHLPVSVDDAHVFEVPASDIAAQLGSPMSAGFVLAGAFATVTSIVAVPSLVAAMRELVPPYRTQHVAANEAAIEAGADARAGAGRSGMAGGGRSMTRRLMQGSEAIAEAAIAAGCRFFTGYPMLPFTELLENMAAKLPAAGGVCINAASELEAVNMAIGAAATGARAATGSCGQGLALMQEGIAELALNELPAVIFNMARGQQDYFQATRGGGWGDYRTITLAPRDVPEAVEHTQLLFDLADRYRTPVILYGDYVIAHASVGIEVEPIEFPPTPPKDWALDGSTTGTGRARQIWTWALGKPNTPGPGPSASWTSIAAKYDAVATVEARSESNLVDDAEVLLVSFGTTSVFVDRVVDDLRAEGLRVGSFRPVTLWPFPGDALAEATRGCAQVLVYELNGGQMIDDVRMYAHDRSVVRSIGGVSQDNSGMRQGNLLDAEVLRRRVLDAVGVPEGAR